MSDSISHILKIKVLNIVINRYVLPPMRVHYRIINNVTPDNTTAITSDKMSIVTHFSTSETLRYIINQKL